MTIAVLADEQQKKEIAESVFFKEHDVVFSENISLWGNHTADVFMDLTPGFSAFKMDSLTRLLPKLIFVNAVSETLSELHPDFIRVNGWPGFLKGDLLEVSASDERRQMAQRWFGDNLVFVSDSPGFISARIVAMIINEAYLTWEAGTGSTTDIDQAMKLGTGYPMGPFEWAKAIGEQEIGRLLKKITDEIADTLKQA